MSVFLINMLFFHRRYVEEYYLTEVMTLQEGALRDIAVVVSN